MLSGWLLVTTRMNLLMFSNRSEETRNVLGGLGGPDRGAVTPHRDDGDGDADDDQHEDDQDGLEPGLVGGQCLGPGDLADQHPGGVGDGPGGDQNFVAGVIALDRETAGPVQGVGGREVGRVDGQGTAQRRRSVGQRRQVLDGVVLEADEIGLRRQFGLAGLDQGLEQTVVQHPQADDGADPGGTLVVLDPVEGQGEADGGQVGGAHIDVDQRRFSVQCLGDGGPDLARQGWHFRRADDRLAVGIDQSQPGDADPFNVGSDLVLAAGGRETGPVGGGDQEVAEISRLGGLAADHVFLGRGAVGGFLLGEREFGHVELEGRVLGELAKGREVLLDPFLDGGDTAVGDDPEADLPGLQVALAFLFDEAKGEEHRGHDAEDQADGAPDDDPVDLAAWFRLTGRPLNLGVGGRRHRYPPASPRMGKHELFEIVTASLGGRKDESRALRAPARGRQGRVPCCLGSRCVDIPPQSVAGAVSGKVEFDRFPRGFRYGDLVRNGWYGNDDTQACRRPARSAGGGRLPAARIGRMLPRRLPASSTVPKSSRPT